MPTLPVVHLAGKTKDLEAHNDYQAAQTQETDSRSLRYHLCSDIRDDLLAEAELILLTVATGTQDATTFPDYHCFASNQTGNTVLLAISLVGLDRGGTLFVPANIGVSLGCFLGAGWAIGQIGHLVGARKRLWLITSQILQTALVFLAAGIQHWYGVKITSAPDLGVIALLSTAAGAQVVLSRALNITEIPTAMATAAWVDLLVDPGILAQHNRRRNRRIAFLAALITGSVIGALALLYDTSALALLISGIIKVIVTIMLLFNKPVNGKTHSRVASSEIKEAGNRKIPDSSK